MSKPKPTLIAGMFKPTSIGGKMIMLLVDGKPRSVAEIAKVVKPRSKDNIVNWYNYLRRIGKTKGLYILSITDDGKFVMKANRRLHLPNAA
jgi:hypothetical protein